MSVQAATEASAADGSESIQTYLTSFNKEIEGGGTGAGQGNQTGASSSTSAAGHQLADAIYTIDGQKLTAGNIVIAADGGAVEGQTMQATADGSGNYPTFMVMNDQQYMLIVSDDADQAGAGDGSGQTLVAVATEDASGGAGTQVIEATATTSDSNTYQAPVNTRKRSLRNAGSAKQTQRGHQTSTRASIKQEVEEMNSGRENDISVYDFNELSGGRGGGTNVTVRTTTDGGDTTGGDLMTEDDEEEEEDEEDEEEGMDDTDEDYKTPVSVATPTHKGRGRPRKHPDGGGHAITKSAKKSAGASAHSGGDRSGNLHVCTYCNYTSNKRYLLSRHLKSHSEDRPHKCGICERGFKTLASLQNHVNTHTGVRPHMCKFCEAAFTTSGELVRHIRYRHTHEKPHRCTECDYASVELSKLKRHMRCHTGERPYQCPHCTYASPDTYKLKRHLRIHTGEKPYGCDVCNQRFTQSNSLKAHRLIHTGNKPIFKCEFCPTTCGRKTDLRIHVQKLHTSDKMLTCKRCDQSFPDRYQFKTHLKTHEGEKCFKCDLCNYASTSARHLESHMLIHTDQKPFTCDTCALSFRQKQLLKRHKNLYHNPSYVAPTPKEKTHECAVCTKAFRHKGNLIRHMQLHDPDSKNGGGGVLIKQEGGGYDGSQLIDDEYYEDEEDVPEVETDVEGGNVSIVTTDGGTTVLEATGGADGTIAITIDPQTHQQLINSSNDQMLFVLQYPDGGDGTGTGGQQQTVVAVHGGNGTGSTSAGAAAPRIISRGGRVTRSAAKGGGGGSSSNSAEVSALFESVTSEETKPNLSNGGNGGEGTSTSGGMSTAPAIAFDPAEQTTSINLEEQLQKQKDLEACFGFKDEDDEDEIILSMPAADGQ